MIYIIKTGLRARYPGTSNISRDISWPLSSLRNSLHFKVTGAFAENMSIRVHLFKNSTESVKVYQNRKGMFCVHEAKKKNDVFACMNRMPSGDTRFLHRPNPPSMPSSLL
jgi:hypothetical protein